MILLERKTDFDRKIIKFVAEHGRSHIGQVYEKSYNEYCEFAYGKEFKEVIFNSEKDYVIINFNKI